MQDRKGWGSGELVFYHRNVGTGLAKPAPSVHTGSIGNRPQDEIDLHALIESQQRLTQSPEPYERVVGSLCVAGILTKRLTQLSDREIGQLVSDYVRNELPWCSPSVAICEEAVQRMIRAVEESTHEVTLISEEEVSR